MLKRSFLVIVLLSGLMMPFSNVRAQMAFSLKNLGVNGGLTVKVPMGSFGDVAGLGLGLMFQGEYVLTPQINVLAGLGYVKYGGKDFGIYSYSYSEIPLMAGAKYYLATQGNSPMRIFILGELGFHRMGYSYQYEYIDIFGNPRVAKYSNASIKMGVTPGAGVEMMIGNFRVDFTGFLALVTGSFSHLGFRATVHFNIQQ